MATTGGRDALLRAAVEHFATHGVDEQSLRTIATAVGSSHRMIIYHFGSREGLLAAVVAEVEATQRAALAEWDAAVASGTLDARGAAAQFWASTVATARHLGPLFFELTAHAMQHRAHAARLAPAAVDDWLPPVIGLLVRGGLDEATAAARARLGLAVARGLLHDMLLTGDEEGTTAAMTEFIDLVLPAPG